MSAMINLDCEKVAIRKRSQDYDCNPPRCRTCIYYTRSSLKQKKELKNAGKKEIEYCSYGDFKTVYFALCNEWRDKSGSTIA